MPNASFRWQLVCIQRQQTAELLRGQKLKALHQATLVRTRHLVGVVNLYVGSMGPLFICLSSELIGRH